MNDDTAPCDRPPLVATTTQVAYRWENPEPEVDAIRSIELEVTEGLTISQDRSAVTGSALSAATLRVLIYDGDGVPRTVLIPLRPATATALRDVADAYDALHHLHVELAQQRTAGSAAREALLTAESAPAPGTLAYLRWGVAERGPEVAP